MAGYSGTPLWKKLGYAPGIRALAVAQPDNYEELLSGAPDGIQRFSRRVSKLDLIHLFCRTEADMRRRFDDLRHALSASGALWISWPKKSSPLAGPLDETGVRRIGLEHGLVDVKVCAVDDDWSGLKFVWRVHDRDRVVER